MDFDGEVRCDYDRIPENFLDDSSSEAEIVVESKSLNISLQGQHFSVDRYIIVYKDARINNLASVQKKREKHKKNILLTFRPIRGKEFFYKFHRFEGIHLLCNE